MYELIITTKYNTIHLNERDFTKEQIKEILEQPYIISVERVKVKNKTKSRRKNNEKRS